MRVGRLTGDSLLGFGVAGALVALAFLTSGNADPDVPVAAGYTWSEIVITLLGAAACAAIPVIGARGRAWGAGTVALFAAFTAFAAISITWSVQPDWAWYGANQLFCYLAAFAGWTEPARDAEMLAWPPDQMRRLERLSRGIQLADENLLARPARFLTDENAQRLEALRATYDPEGRFLSYLMPEGGRGVRLRGVVAAPG